MIEETILLYKVEEKMGSRVNQTSQSEARSHRFPPRLLHPLSRPQANADRRHGISPSRLETQSKQTQEEKNLFRKGQDDRSGSIARRGFRGTSEESRAQLE
jgi:hypothetical protein